MKILKLIFLTLFFTRFFDITLISKAIFLAPLLPFVFIEINKKSLFKRYILFFITGLFISFISSYIYRDQKILESFVASANFFFIFYYFMLRRLPYSLKDMERALYVIVLIFCLSYIIQYLIYPTAIFAGANVEYDDVRIRLAGQGFSSLGFFFSLNKLLIEKKYALLNITVLILCATVLILMAFRTMLAGLFLYSVFMTFKVFGFNWKILLYGLAALIIAILLIQIPIFAEKIDSLLERNENANFSNPGYIRLTTLTYYTTQHFTDLKEFLMGSGIPKIGDVNSKYGDQIYSLVDRGIIWADWGLLGLSWMIGPITVSILILLAIKVFRIKMPKHYYYIGIWYIYLLTISITTKEFYRDGNFVVHAFVLSLAERVVNQYKNQINS